MSAFEQQYGSLSYTEGLPDYYGLPLEQINKTYEVLNQKYELNTKKWSALRQNIANSAILKSETQSIDKALSNANKTMSDITRTGNFHLADIAVDDALYQFTTDRDMKAAFEKKANKEIYFKDLDERVKSKSIDGKTRSQIQAEWESINSVYTHHDETGRLVNGVINRDVADYVDINEKFDKYFGNIKASDTQTLQSATNIKNAMKSGAFTSYGEYYRFLSSQKGVSDPRVLNLLEGILNEPKTQAYMKQTAELNLMSNFAVKNTETGLYNVTPNRQIELRTLSPDEFIKQGFVFTDNGKTLVATSPRRNSQGKLINDGGIIVNSINDAGKVPIANYPIDPNNLQQSLYSVILAQEYSNMQHSGTAFALAHSYVESKYQFERSSQYEINAERGKKLLDVVQTVSKFKADNASEISTPKEKSIITDYEITKNMDNLNAALKVLGVDGTITSKNIYEVYQKYNTYIQDSRLDNAKGNAARKIIGSINAIQANQDDNNSYVLSTLQEYANKDGINNSAVDAFLAISSKFLNHNAPIDFLDNTGNQLNKAASLYCQKHNIEPSIKAFKNNIGLSDSDIENAKYTKFASISLGNETHQFNRPVALTTNIGFAGVKDKPLQDNINKLISNAISDANITGKVLVASSGNQGFSKGAEVSYLQFSQNLSQKYGLNFTTINKGIKLFLESTETSGSQTFDMGDKGKVIITKPQGTLTNDGKNYVGLGIQVVTNKGKILENNLMTWSVGTKDSEINAREFAPLENPRYLAHNKVETLKTENVIRTGEPILINNTLVSKYQYIPNEGIKFPKQLLLSKGMQGLNDLNSSTVNGVEMVTITDNNVASTALELVGY